MNEAEKLLISSINELAHVRAELTQARAELNRMHQDAQDQSDEVQELWLSPCEAEGLKRQLAGMEAQVASTREAVEWIWGYWDGNTLVARSSGYDEEIGAAWNKLLEASGAFGKPQQQAGEAERNYWFKECRIEQMVKRLVQLEQLKGGQALQAERLLRREAETIMDRALSLAKAPSTFDDGTPMDAFTRILWLKEKIDALRAERHRLQHSLDSQLKTTRAERDKRRRTEGLAALVTPELAELLERLATWTKTDDDWSNSDIKRIRRGIAADCAQAHELAALIREALGETERIKMLDPACPRCGGDCLRRETRRIPSVLASMRYATGGWWLCLDCGCCFDGVTDHDDGVLPWWVEKRPAGRVRIIAERTK